MIVFLLLIVVLLIGLTAAAVMGRIGGFMADPTTTHSFCGLPPDAWGADDVGRLRFDHGLRGYRMDQVDEVLDALAARLRELEKAVDSVTVDGAAGGVGHAAASQSRGDSPQL